MKKRVLIISGSMPPLKCGIGYYTSQLLDKLTQAAKVTLLTTEGLETHPGVAQTLYTPSWKITKLPYILRTIRHSHPELVHIQYPAKGYKRQLGINFYPLLHRLVFRQIRLVVTLHEYSGSAILGRTRNLITAAFAHKIILSNLLDQRSLPAGLRHKSLVIPIGSNIDRWPRNHKTYTDIMEKAGFDLAATTLMFFGFAFKSKGLDILIEAAQKTNSQLLLITGFDKNDAYHLTLERQIDLAKQAGAKIYVTGFLEDQKVSEIMQECQIFVLAQSLPLTGKSGSAIAASTHGCLVVSTAADDAELNQPYIDGQNAILIKPMTAERLADTLQKLSTDHGQLDRLQKNAATLADYHAWDKIVDQHIKLYEGL